VLRLDVRVKITLRVLFSVWYRITVKARICVRD
jgi:hypothetical protein